MARDGGCRPAAPHRTTELALEALSGDAGLDLLQSLVGPGRSPTTWNGGSSTAPGNPFFLEELVRSLADAGSLVHEGNAWRYDHDAAVEIPPTVEVILARIDRLDPRPHAVLMAASVLGREFELPLLDAVSGDGDVRPSLSALMRLDLIREARRWPEPEYRFKHALIQETAYRTLVVQERQALHAKAATWLEERYEGRVEEVAGLLAHHWLAAADEDKAVAYLTKAGDRARQEYALDEAIAYYRELLPILGRRGEQNAIALVFKLALAFHMSLRFSEANEMYQRAFDLWRWPDAPADGPTASLRVGTSFLPNDPDPGRRSRGRTSSCACSCSTGSSRRGRNGRSCRRSRSGGESPTTGSATCSTCARASRGRTANRSRRATSSSGSSGC